MAQYPGVSFTTIGGKIKQIVNGPATNSLLIIGSALDGPINQPVSITDPTQAEQVFGPANYRNGYLDPTTGTETGKYAGATIPLAISHAIAAGCQDIRAVRVTGTKATATMGSLAVPITARYAGRVYNTRTVTTSISGNTFTLAATQPLAKGGTFTITADASGTTLAEFIARVNGAFANKVIDLDDTDAGVQASLSSSLSSISSTLTGTATLTGGTNGCFARSDDYGPENFTSAGSGLFGYATALITQDTGTFDAIRNQRAGFDICLLTGVCVDDQVVAGANATTTSIMNDFADFIDACKAELQPCHGVICTRSHGKRDDASIISYVNSNLLSTTAGYYSQPNKWIKAGYILYTGRLRPGARGTIQDIFANVSVVAGPDAIYNHPDMGGDYTWNWGASYAALLTVIPPEYSTTQQPLPGVKGFTRPYPQKYAQKLLDGVGSNGQEISGMGAYVTLVKDQRAPNGPLVVNDDATAAARDSQFRNFQTHHMCNSIQKDLQNALGRYVGQPSGPGILAAMEAAVQNVLDGYVVSEGLRGGRGIGYDFQVVMAGLDGAIGTISVILELALSTAIRKINIITSVRQVS
jgi:hypothetical protein